MLDFIRRFFAVARPPAPPPPPSAGPVEGNAAIMKMREAFPGQAQDALLLFNTALMQMGRDLVGASPEPTPEIIRHVDEMAVAQGEAWSASQHDSEAFLSDARAEELRRDGDEVLQEALGRVAEERTYARDARTRLDDTEPASGEVAALGFLLSAAAGVAGAVVLNPTVLLLLGDTFKRAVGEDYVVIASGTASLLLGLVPPFLAMAAASARAPWWKIAGLGALELVCIAGLAWGRAQLLGTVPTGIALTTAEASMVSGAGTSRSAMMFALECLLIVSVTGIGMQVSSLLVRVDRRRHAEERAARGERVLTAAREEAAAARTWRGADHERMTRRDVAAERGEKVRKLCRQLIWQGVLEQTQANWDGLHGAPRAVVGANAVTGA